MHIKNTEKNHSNSSNFQEIHELLTLTQTFSLFAKMTLLIKPHRNRDTVAIKCLQHHTKLTEPADDILLLVGMLMLIFTKVER